MIAISGVNKWFGDHHVLRDIDLVVGRGREGGRLRPVRVRQVHDDPVHQPP